MSYHIKFDPIGLRGHCRKNSSLLDCARQLNVGLASICGGQGKCHACKVQVLKGNISELTDTEQKVLSPQEISDGWRLACMTYPTSDCSLYIPAESMTTLQRMQVESTDSATIIEPIVKACQVKLTTPSLYDLRSDATRILETLNQQRILCNNIEIDVLRNMSTQIRDWNWEARVLVRGDEVIAVAPLTSRRLGLAIDLGSTKIAGYLVDLDTGKTLAAKGMMNPQISYGEDITSRISYALKSSDEASHLQKLAVSAIDQLAIELCSQVDVKMLDIVDAVIVGNTAMHHLILGLPVKQLAYSPFVAAVQQSLDIKARDIGFHLTPGAYVHILPNIAGFVGADHISMLLAIDAGQINRTTIAIDIGTNTEVSLINNEVIYSVSCASGPAFEGGHIKHGMRAASGAIERLRVVNNNIEYQTIDNESPIGICGSGVIDALAQLYLAGILDESGRIKPDGLHTHNIENQREVILTKKNGNAVVTLTQYDIRELQLAKAAIRSGIQVLLETAGCSETEVEQVIIGGAFGTFIDVSNAITIGMLPSLPLNRFNQIGNAAGLGARIALLSHGKRLEAQELASKVRYIELARALNFMQTFAQAHYLGEYRIINGKRN
ncbi:ASKHA domain-containing protein [Chloroflexota bacterium]